MQRFVWMGVVAQIAMVVAGHYSEGVLALSGPLGTGIPFLLGLWYGSTVPTSMKESATGGFVIGIVGAFVGVVVAILMGDQTWMLLTFAPLSSGITGVLGAAIATGVTGRAKGVAA